MAEIGQEITPIEKLELAVKKLQEKQVGLIGKIKLIETRQGNVSGKIKSLDAGALKLKKWVISGWAIGVLAVGYLFLGLFV